MYGHIGGLVAISWQRVTGKAALTEIGGAGHHGDAAVDVAKEQVRWGLRWKRMLSRDSEVRVER